MKKRANHIFVDEWACEKTDKGLKQLDRGKEVINVLIHSLMDH